MSTVLEIEHAVERLSQAEFLELAAWIERQRTQRVSSEPMTLRDHSAFLSGYTPEDEGLYDDAATR